MVPPAKGEVDLSKLQHISWEESVKYSVIYMILEPDGIKLFLNLTYRLSSIYILLQTIIQVSDVNTTPLRHAGE